MIILGRKTKKSNCKERTESLEKRRAKYKTQTKIRQSIMAKIKDSQNATRHQGQSAAHAKNPAGIGQSAEGSKTDL